MTEVEKGQKALQVLRDLYSVYDLGDYVYDVREHEGLDWDGPKVTTWSNACVLAEELIK
jgi:hypothetical protein